MLGKHNVLIGESGGSKTDWIHVDCDGEINKFSTRSFRTDSFNAKDIEVERARFKAYNVLNCEVLFFGAGCHTEAGKKRQLDLLECVGFLKTKIFSDLDAAALAVYGFDKSGWVAIHGTGSVLFYWNGRSVSQLIGGLGFDQGDEGSGAHLGRVVYDAYNTKSLSSPQQNEISDFLKENESAEKTKSFYVGLGNVISRSKNNWRVLHEKNMSDFTSKYLKDFGSKHVSIVGGYGFNNQDVVKDSYAYFKVEIDCFVERPIKCLFEQIEVLIE